MPTNNPILLNIENNVLSFSISIGPHYSHIPSKPFTHLTASSLHKITKKKNHTPNPAISLAITTKKNCTLNTQAYSTPSLYYSTLEH